MRVLLQNQGVHMKQTLKKRSLHATLCLLDFNYCRDNPEGTVPWKQKAHIYLSHLQLQMCFLLPEIGNIHKGLFPMTIKTGHCLIKTGFLDMIIDGKSKSHTKRDRVGQKSTHTKQKSTWSWWKTKLKIISRLLIVYGKEMMHSNSPCYFK